jgi:hypothetical protein
MAQTLAGTITITPDLSYVNALSDGANITDVLSWAQAVAETYADGVGANKAQVMYHARRTQAGSSGAVENLDLAGGLVNGFGTITFTKIKFIWIHVRTLTTAYNLLVGGAASNPVVGLFGDAASDKQKICAGGQWFISSPVDGITVTAGSADILAIDNPSAGAVEYDIVIVGEGSIA